MASDSTFYNNVRQLHTKNTRSWQILHIFYLCAVDQGRNFPKTCDVCGFTLAKTLNCCSGSWKILCDRYEENSSLRRSWWIEGRRICTAVKQTSNAHANEPINRVASASTSCTCGIVTQGNMQGTASCCGAGGSWNGQCKNYPQNDNVDRDPVFPYSYREGLLACRQSKSLLSVWLCVSASAKVDAV